MTTVRTAAGAGLLVLLLLATAAPAFAADEAPQEEKSALDRAVEDYRAKKDAEGTPTYPTMGEIVVSGVRGVPLTYPGGRDVITKRELEEIPSGNVQDVLRAVPGVFVQPETNNDGRVNIAIRGNDPRRSGQITLLIDGIPSTEGPYGQVDQDSLPISMERVYRLDVIRGGANIRYGPNSAGGVINFITEPIPVVPLLRFSGRYGSHDDYALWSSVGGTWGDFGFLFTTVVKGGDGFRDHNDHTIYDDMLKFRLRLSDIETLEGKISYYDEDSENPWGLTKAEYEEDRFQSTYVGGHFEAERLGYVLTYTRNIDARTYLGVEAWFKDLDRKLVNNYMASGSDPAYHDPAGYRVQDTWSNAGGIEVRYAAPLDFSGLDTDLFVSGRFLGEKVGNHYYRQPFGGPPSDPTLNNVGSAWSTAVFAEDTMHLSDTVDWAVGARAESLVMSSRTRNDGSTQTSDWFLFLPETHAEWRFLPESAVFASYQESFGPPQYETGFDPSSDFYQRVKPERVRLFEVGARTRTIEGLDASLTLYYTRFRNRLQFRNLPGGDKEAYNSGKEVHYGFEAGVSYDFAAASDALDGFRAFATLTSIHAEVLNGEFEGNRPPNTPEWMASWGVRWDHPSGIWAKLTGDSSGSAYKDAANSTEGSIDGQNGPVPSFTVWDASVGWRENPDGSGLSVAVGMTNLFDAEYFRRFVGGKFTGAPRQEFITATYELHF